MVRYNLKYTGKRTEKGDGSTREFMLTKKDPDVLPKEESSVRLVYTTCLELLEMF